MYLECTCTGITIDEWDSLMSGAVYMDKEELNNLVKEHLPYLYELLALDFYNPYAF